jgi:hypothetical protein
LSLVTHSRTGFMDAMPSACACACACVRVCVCVFSQAGCRRAFSVMEWVCW